MPKIRCSPPSPYSAKVRMSAKYAGIAFESVVTDTGNPSADFLTDNPLGKIPVFITDEGESIYDSRAITQYLNRVSRNALFPRNAAKRTEAERLEALADGICDAFLAHVYERRFRPEEMWQQSWLDAQWAKAMRGLDVLDGAPPKLPKKITAGQIAVRACLAYASLRFEGKWERGRSKLTRWAKRFDDKFPELTEFLPRAS